MIYNRLGWFSHGASAREFALDAFTRRGTDCTRYHRYLLQCSLVLNESQHGKYKATPSIRTVKVTPVTL